MNITVCYGKRPNIFASQCILFLLARCYRGGLETCPTDRLSRLDFPEADRGNPFTVTELNAGSRWRERQRDSLSFHGDKKNRRRLVRVRRCGGPSPRTTGYIRSGSKVTIIEHDIFVPGR